MATRTISNAGGNYNATGTWNEGVVPTNADDVVATATSGPLTVNVASVARSMDLTGYTNTLTLTNNLTLGGTTAQASLEMCKLATGMTLTGSAGIFFGGTYTTNPLTIDLMGKTLPGNTSFNAAGRWKLVSTFACIAFIHTTGTLDLNGQTINCTSFQSTGSVARTLTCGTATINASQGTSSAFQFTGSNLTLSAGSATMNMTGASSAFVVTHTGLTFGTVNITGSGTEAIQGSFTCATLTRTGTAAHNDRLFMSQGPITVTGTLTITDNSGTGIWCGPGTRVDAAPTAGVTATIALGATGTAVLSGVTFTDVTFTGTNTPVTGTRIGDGLGNSGVTFDASRTLYWVGNAGNTSDSAHWSLTSGGSGGQPCPLPQDDVTVDANSISLNSNSITPTYDRICRNFTWTNNRVGSAMGAGGHVFGNYDYDGAGSSAGLTFRGRGSHTLRRGPFSTTMGGPFVLVAPGGTYTLASNMTFSNSVTITAGTLALGTFTFTTTSAGVIANSGTLTRAIDLGTGTLYIQGSTTPITFGTAASGFTLSGTGTIRTAGGGTMTITSNGQTIPNLISNSTTLVQVADALNVSGVLTHERGTFNAGGFSVTCGSYVSNNVGGTRLLQPNGGTFTINGDFVISDATGYTVGASAGTINVNPTAQQSRFAAAGVSFGIVVVNLKPAASATSRLTVETGGTFATLTIDGSAATHGVIVFQDNVTVTGTLTVTGNGVGNEVYLYGPDWGGSATITAATTTLSHVVTNRIVGAGAGSWTGTNVTMTDDGWKQAVGA